jgi:hypothetical protein
MYIFYGFSKFTPLIDNALDVVNKLGELSDDSLTYAKDKSTHTNSESPQTVLVGFHSVMDDNHVDVPEGMARRCLQMCQWLYNRAQAGQVTTNVNQLLGSLQSEFGDQATTITLGPLLLHNGIRLPTWVGYKDTVMEDDNEIKVWFSDDSFKAEYPGYHIDVIPPIEDIDELFQGEARVQELLNEYSLADRFNQVQTIRGQYPYTLFRAEDYQWINPVNPERKLTTPWIVVIYGRAGNNPDLIKEAIVDYILANSERPREDWEDLIPDLLLSTEFIFVPMWHQYAIDNLELEAGIHSPIVRPSEAIALTQMLVKGNGYSEEWINTQTEYVGVIFKSLVMSVVGNPNNRTGITQFSEQFSDYILVTNNSGDFNRMSVRTQLFKDLMNELITLADKTTPTTQVPVEYSRLTRNGIVYVGKQYENILYLVATRYSEHQVANDMGIMNG